MTSADLARAALVNMCDMLDAIHGVVESHVWCKRVNTGREGIELRDRIVSMGARADDRVVVTECRFFPLDESRAAA